MTNLWPLPIRLLHWSTAGLVLVAVPAALLAQRLTEIDTPVAENLIEAHMAAGLTIALITLARLSLRLVLSRPKDPERPLALDLLVRAGTVSFYGLLLSLPATGILKLTLSGLDVSILGATIVPASGTAPAVARALSRLHAILGWVLVATALLHVAATLLHARLFGSPVMPRMALRLTRDDDASQGASSP